jgi:transposase
VSAGTGVTQASHSNSGGIVEQSFQYFVGIDWGTQTHRVAVLDGTGRPVEQYNADHSGEGLVTLVNKLKQRTACEPALVALGIEVAWGALVETLVEAGFAVFSINPKQVDRFRDRFTVAGAKDDACDALVLANSLYTDRQSYRKVEIDSPELIRLRELSRFQDELKVELRRVTNRLWQQLHRYYPQMLAISPAADDRLVWDLLEAAPTPAAGAKITSLRILRILKANRIRKVSVDEVHAALRTAPLVLAPGAAEAACEHVQLLLPQVRLLEEQLRKVGNRIKCLLTVMTEANAGTEQPPCDARLVLSLPGIGPAVAAALLTEASSRSGSGITRHCAVMPARLRLPGKVAREKPSACVRLAVRACETQCSTGPQAAFAAIAEAEGSTTHCGLQATFTHERCAAWPTDC